MIHDRLPIAMRNARRWLLWKSVPNPDSTKKPRKMPGEYLREGKS